MRPLNFKIDNFFHFDFKSNSTLLVDAQKTNDAILLLFGKPGKTELPDWLLYIPAKSCQYMLGFQRLVWKIRAERVFWKLF